MRIHFLPALAAMMKPEDDGVDGGADVSSPLVGNGRGKRSAKAKAAMSAAARAAAREEKAMPTEICTLCLTSTDQPRFVRQRSFCPTCLVVYRAHHRQLNKRSKMAGAVDEHMMSQDPAGWRADHPHLLGDYKCTRIDRVHASM